MSGIEQQAVTAKVYMDDDSPSGYLHLAFNLSGMLLLLLVLVLGINFVMSGTPWGSILVTTLALVAYCKSTLYLYQRLPREEAESIQMVIIFSISKLLAILRYLNQRLPRKNASHIINTVKLIRLSDILD